MSKSILDVDGLTTSTFLDYVAAQCDKAGMGEITIQEYFTLMSLYCGGGRWMRLSVDTAYVHVMGCFQPIVDKCRSNLSALTEHLPSYDPCE